MTNRMKFSTIISFVERWRYFEEIFEVLESNANFPFEFRDLIIFRPAIFTVFKTYNIDVNSFDTISGRLAFYCTECESFARQYPSISIEVFTIKEIFNEDYDKIVEIYSEISEVEFILRYGKPPNVNYDWINSFNENISLIDLFDLMKELQIKKVGN